MSRTTFEDYKNAIWQEYEIIKKNDVTGVFSDLSPAMVRNCYVRLIDNGLSKMDEEIMKMFFETKENESIKKSIINSNTDKLKPVISFLIGKTKNPDQNIRVELAAILISFEQRPYNKFSKTEIDKGSDDFEIGTYVKTDTDKFEADLLVEDVVEVEVQRNQELQIVSKKKTLAFLSVLGFLCFFFFIYFYNTKSKSCLQWKNDRFVEVDCESQVKGFVDLESKQPYNEGLLLLRKINPTDTTTYFKDGKAIVWYCKDNEGNVELFNAPGYHPESGKPLKAITKYIIKEHLVQE